MKFAYAAKQLGTVNIFPIGKNVKKVSKVGGAPKNLLSLRPGSVALSGHRKHFCMRNPWFGVLPPKVVTQLKEMGHAYYGKKFFLVDDLAICKGWNSEYVLDNTPKRYGIDVKCHFERKREKERKRETLNLVHQLTAKKGFMSCRKKVVVSPYVRFHKERKG